MQGKIYRNDENNIPRLQSSKTETNNHYSMLHNKLLPLLFVCCPHTRLKDSIILIKEKSTNLPISFDDLCSTRSLKLIIDNRDFVVVFFFFRGLGY